MCRQMRTRRRAYLSRCHLMADGDICHQMTIAFDNAAAGEAADATPAKAAKAPAKKGKK